MKQRGDLAGSFLQNHLVKKGFLAVLAMILVLGTAIPAAAVPFTSGDGIISINLPNGNWSEIEDPDHWITLSDGSNRITIQHFSNGEKLPKIPIAASPYVQTLSASISTQNEVFTAFGFVTDNDAAYDIYEALASLRILEYDTKTAVARSVSNSDYTVAPVDMTLYVSVSEEDGGALNVRKSFSTKSDLLGKLDNGTAVHIIGIVKQKGADFGWYKIDYDGSYGYVSADYLIDAEPVYTEDTEPVYTEE